jgi:hypothetical protein
LAADSRARLPAPEHGSMKKIAAERTRDLADIEEITGADGRTG